MIVDPDFVDHWKTRMLVDLLGGDEVAPVYVIRLWAHCQQRREWRFDPLPTAALKAICRYQGDGKRFEEAMLAAGFVTRDGEILTAVGWDEYNATLIANWANGKKGGRPKKEKKNPSDNPGETHGLSTGSPRQTQGVTHEEPIRLDEIREEIKGSGSSNAVVRASRLPKDWQPSEEEISFCRTERPDLNVESVAAQFRDYWVAKGGRDGAKLDWSATWRNWVRRQASNARTSPTRNFNDRNAETIAALTGRSRDHEPDNRTIDM